MGELFHGDKKMAQSESSGVRWRHILRNSLCADGRHLWKIASPFIKQVAAQFDGGGKKNIEFFFVVNGGTGSHTCCISGKSIRETATLILDRVLDIVSTKIISGGSVEITQMIGHFKDTRNNGWEYYAKRFERFNARMVEELGLSYNAFSVNTTFIDFWIGGQRWRSIDCEVHHGLYLHDGGKWSRQ